jgi:hypothetical protein
MDLWDVGGIGCCHHVLRVSAVYDEVLRHWCVYV